MPKYRRKVFSKELLDIVQSYFEKVLDDFEATLVEFNGESDHVHLLIEYPPKHSISRMANSLKGVSSRYLRQYHWKKVSPFLWGKAFWSPSYFAGSAGGATNKDVGYDSPRPFSSLL